MQHEEAQDPRQHPHHWEHWQHRRHPDHPRHFQDSGSRWGEPMPSIPPQQGWRPNETDRFLPRGRPYEEEWLPGHRYEHRHPTPPHRGEQPMHEPAWFQRGEHFHPSNQRVEDRWFEDPLMPPPPRRRPPRHYDGFWQAYED